jgi:hypothetical protein
LFFVASSRASQLRRTSRRLLRLTTPDRLPSCSPPAIHVLSPRFPRNISLSTAPDRGVGQHEEPRAEGPQPRSADVWSGWPSMPVLVGKLWCSFQRRALASTSEMRNRESSNVRRNGTTEKTLSSFRPNAFSHWCAGRPRVVVIRRIGLGHQRPQQEDSGEGHCCDGQKSRRAAQAAGHQA